MKLTYLKLYTDFGQDIEALTDEEVGRLLRAMLIYAETEEAPELTGNERILWGVASKMVDKEREGYEKMCDRNKANRNRTQGDQSSPVVTSRHQSSPVVTSRDDSSQEKNKRRNKEKGNLKITEKERTPLEVAIDEFAENRIKLHAPMTDRAKELMLSKLDSLASTDEEKIEILHQSIERGYKGIFPVHTERGSPKKMGSNAGYKQTALTEDDFASMFVDLNKEVLCE